MNDYAASLIRTVVPMAVGFLVSLFPDLDTVAASTFLASLLGAVYYALVRLAEAKLGPRWGWLLGLPRPPSY